MGRIGRWSSAVFGVAVGALVCAATASAAFPGLNGKIAWERAKADGSEIWIANGDGSNPTNLTPDFAPSASSPSFSADGRRLVFSAAGNLATMNADGSDPVVSTFDFAGRAVFTPDGQQIIFAAGSESGDSGPHDHKLYVVNADGSDLRQITHGDSMDDHPDWSPDGEWIAFMRNGELWLVHPDGSDGHMLLERTYNREAWMPKSSPDGQEFSMEYKWEIKPHILSVHFKGFDFEYHGIIFFKAAEEQVVQIGVDSRGGNGKGVWEAEYGKAVFKSEHAGEYGEVSRMGFVYSKVDANSMKSELYSLDEYGTLGDEPAMTLEYKRQKQATPKKSTGTN